MCKTYIIYLKHLEYGYHDLKTTKKRFKPKWPVTDDSQQFSISFCKLAPEDMQFLPFSVKLEVDSKLGCWQIGFKSAEKFALE